jgi:hypothetical protein
MSSSPANRPRVEPGIPAGGVAALVVTAAIVLWSLLAGEPAQDDGALSRLQVAGNASEDHPARPLPPLPPEPPAPPTDAAAARDAVHSAVRDSVREALSGGDLDVDAIRRAAEQAAEAAATENARGLDTDGLRQGALQAAEQARADADRIRAEANRLRNGTAGSQTAEHAAHEQTGGALAASFTAPRGVRLVNVTGDIAIESSSKARDVRLEVDDNASTVETAVVDGVLTVIGRSGSAAANLRLVIPASEALTLTGVTGDVSLSGRHKGPVVLDILRGNVTLDSAPAVTVTIRESGDVTLDRVEGRLVYTMLGQGSLTVDRAGAVSLSIPGSAQVNMDRIDEMTLDLQGQAEVVVNRVNGPVKAALLGSGSVTIAGGEASPLQVAITGSAEFRFDGIAVDPVVLVSGSGSAHVAKYRGQSRVQSTGSGTARVGN